MSIQGRLVSSALTGITLPHESFLFFIFQKNSLFPSKWKKKKCNNFKDLDKHFLKHWQTCWMIPANRLKWKCIRGKEGRNRICSCPARKILSSVEVNPGNTLQEHQNFAAKPLSEAKVSPELGKDSMDFTLPASCDLYPNCCDGAECVCMWGPVSNGRKSKKFSH